MIGTVFAIGLRRLIHNRVELLLTFVVPICFFSIFALIFGRGMGTTPRVKTVLVDEARNDTSTEVIEQFRQQPGLRIMHSSEESLTREEATRVVRQGTATLAIVLKTNGQSLEAELLADSSDQVAPPIVTALVTRALLQNQGMKLLIPQQGESKLPDGVFAKPDRASESGSTPVPDYDPRTPLYAPPSVDIIDVMESGKSNPVVSMYAAGIAVMFLLFGATNGGGALLEERENQTLERLLATQLNMDQLLLGKWLYQSAVGTVQVTVMFLFGQLVFGIDLGGHLGGFAVMTLITAAAASAFGLFLAALCKSRGQLSGLSVIVILTMSALGGSMVPRYVMSEDLRQAGLWTFNAWALDGFDKVFWRDLPIEDLGPQVMVLTLCTACFLIVARLLAFRWETD